MNKYRESQINLGALTFRAQQGDDKTNAYVEALERDGKGNIVSRERVAEISQRALDTVSGPRINRVAGRRLLIRAALELAGVNLNPAHQMKV